MDWKNAHTIRKLALKIAGIVLLGSVIARLGLVDIWEMEVFWRIIAFFGIGALFIAAAFFEKPFEQEHLVEDTNEPPTPPQPPQSHLPQP